MTIHPAKKLMEGGFSLDKFMPRTGHETALEIAEGIDAYRNRVDTSFMVDWTLDQFVNCQRTDKLKGDLCPTCGEPLSALRRVAIRGHKFLREYIVCENKHVFQLPPKKI